MTWVLRLALALGCWQQLMALALEAESSQGSRTDASTAGLACEASGFCSIGQVQPFRGDVYPSPALKSCLAARSFRKEIILLTETRLNPAYQTFRSLLSLGYEHVVLLSLPDRCERSAALWPRLACVWSSQRFVSNTKYLLDRVALLTRAARLGYNVLMLDSDVVPLRDVYAHLKAPPLANATIATMRDGNGWINCGVVYVQNARPDGPTAYMLAEVVDRLERWGEDPHFVTSRGNPAGCWDQQMYSDTLLSALAGRPLSYGCWYRGEPSAARVSWHAAHQRVFGTQEAEALDSRHYLQATSHPWPPELLADFPDFPLRHVTETWSGVMQVPNTLGEWPEDLGGPLYPPQRGPSARAWMDTLRSDVLPLWPDPEDPSQASAGAAITEQFAYLPLYLAQSWSNGGAHGYWNPALRRRRRRQLAAAAGQDGGEDGGAEEPASQPGSPPVALAHFVHVPGGATNKLTVKMASGHWDWDVAHAVHPNRGVFFASTRIAPLPDVLAFTPDLERSEWGDEGAFAAAVGALLRLAAETGRAAAFPAPRCNLSWLGGAGNEALPLQVNHGAHIPYAPVDRGFDDLRCLWGGYLQYGCQAVRSYFAGGLLAPEWDHMVALLTHNATAAAAAAAANLRSLGFAPAAVAHVTATLSHPASPSSHSAHHPSAAADVVTVPAELLTPPGGGDAWDVRELASRLMHRYGGPGSGLLYGNGSAGGGGGGAAAHVSAGGGWRPRVLLLPQVPRLGEAAGPRMELFRRELEHGADRAVMSCEWVRTGRPYRRRR